MKNLARRASSQAKDVTDKWGLSEETTAGLIKLALYDFILLCDDSNSMELENRKQMLVNTIRQVATFATVLEPSGITVRFVNHDEDSTFDNMVDVGDIIAKVRKVDFRGDTKLGTMLDRKVVQPMIIQRAKERTLKKPVIVVIITDGEPSENPQIIGDTIYDCKTNGEVKAYGDAAVVFLVSQVGNSENATAFLRELEADRKVKGMVYCSTDKLDDLSRKEKGGRNDRTYIAQVGDLFPIDATQQVLSGAWD
ncbi:MAG: hypothetical protein M1813_004952 [Trichoglossum hirsutum]|nr:MAG: hypothetical protein M1813_004952 [Trichoglossum hirsutum]